MAEVCISIAAEVAKYLVDPLLRGARYLFCFNQFIEDVKKVKDELESTLAGVIVRKEDAARKTEEITPPVKKWLNDVENILQEMQKLLEKVGGGGKNCFNVSLRYSLAKEMANKAKQMVELKENANFEPFSLLIQLPGIRYFSSKDFVDFDSRKSTYDRLLKAIEDEKNKMVGLYGMGGSGKTTLAKEVGKKVAELKLFDKVIMAVVSQPPNVGNIQGQIGDQIDLKFEEETESGRAQRLSIGLQNKKILIILDDVWGKLNLEDIGIPLNEGCRILLTTRLQDVCVSMDCESIIKLPLLTKEEAWALFKMRANIINDFSNKFDDVGRKIVDECKGLAIAIVTVGSSLKGKNIEQWELALSRLKHSQPLDIEEGLRSPYACLELSYDNLRSPIAKSLFLLCSMFPEDCEINKEDLIRFGKGALELGKTVDTMEDARREIFVAIDILLDSCLLMPTDKQVCVKMHDLVRDVALWIAEKKDQIILQASHGVPKMLVENETVKDTEVISLWNLEKNLKLFDQLHCPTLKVLLLHSEEDTEEPNVYLGGMEALKVLALIRYSFTWDSTRRMPKWSMPQSIELLTHLCTLCLRGNTLGDISILGKLKRLEILDLRGSSFDELPIGIVDMKKLKLLDLYGCSIDRSPYQVIGGCLKLYICHPSKCPENVSFPRLQRYAISVTSGDENIFANDPLVVLDEFEASRVLAVEGYNISALNSSLEYLFLGADFLFLVDCRGDNKESFSKVKFLCLAKCPEVKFIIDNTDANILQDKQPLDLDLSQLFLRELPELEFIWKGPTQILSLQRLKEVKIGKCPKLKTIFTPTIVTSLPELVKLDVEECNELEEIFSADSFKNLSASSHNFCFPKLCEILIEDCNKLKWLFSDSLACHCPSLDNVWIRDCSALEVVVQGIEGRGLADRVLFPKLTDLTLTQLPKLREIFPGFEYDEFLHDIEDCPNIRLIRKIPLE